MTISGGLLANNKVYDTNTSATIAITGTQTLAGLVGSDVGTTNVSVSSTGPYTGATFSQPDVGSGLTVTPATSVVNGLTTMTGVTLTGVAAGNYYVTGVGPQILTANITPAPLVITQGSAPSVMYNGAAQTGVNTYTQSGLLTGSSITGFATNTAATGTHVGTYTGSISGATGSNLTNYNISYVNGSLAITPYIIDPATCASPCSVPNIAASANNKVYDTTTTASGALTAQNLFAGDSLTVNYGSANFNNANVGNTKPVTFATITISGPSAADYAILGGGSATATANITPAPLTISGLIAANKQYDGNTVAVVTGTPAIAGLLGSDTSTLTGSVLSGTFASSNPATGVGVTANLSSLFLGNSNYYIAGVTFPLTADITSPPQTINNMEVVTNQVATQAQLFTVAPVPLINQNKSDIIYVRDKDDLGKYMQAIEVPSSGAFKFPVPDQIVQDLINVSGENASTTNQLSVYRLLLLPRGTRLVATLADGSPLPAGVQFTPANKNFSVPKLGEVTLPLSVKVTLMRGNEVLSDKTMVVTK